MQRLDSVNDRFLGSRRIGLNFNSCSRTLVIASVLPALWLVVSAQSLFAPAAGCVTCSAVCAFNREESNHEHSPLDFAFQSPARPTPSRPGLQSGPDRLACPPDAAVGCPDLTPETLFFNQPESSLVLARTWQFDLRAALEPRAPSSVS